jgi:hypothetical protein
MTFAVKAWQQHMFCMVQHSTGYRTASQPLSFKASCTQKESGANTDNKCFAVPVKLGAETALLDFALGGCVRAKYRVHKGFFSHSQHLMHTIGGGLSDYIQTNACLKLAYVNKRLAATMRSNNSTFQAHKAASKPAYLWLSISCAIIVPGSVDGMITSGPSTSEAASHEHASPIRLIYAILHCNRSQWSSRNSRVFVTVGLRRALCLTTQNQGKDAPTLAKANTWLKPEMPATQHTSMFTM